MRRLAIDTGSRRIGLAAADEDAIVGEALDTLSYEDPADAVRAIVRLIADERVGELVVGLPLGMDGTENQACRRARALGDAVGAQSGLPVVYWDERFTSRSAIRGMVDSARQAGRARAGVGRRQKSGEVDRAAAVLLIESYLDALRARTGP